MKTFLPNTFFILLLFSFGLFVSNSNKDYEDYLPISGEVISSAPLYGSGSPGNLTGSPGDSGQTCTNCHGGSTSYSLVPTISTDIPGTGYVFSQTYLITVSTSSSADNFGFELTAEKSDNSNVGVFDVSGATGSPKLIVSNSSVTNSSKDFSQWTFNWTAPATNEGQITFYAAVLAGSGSGTNNDETVLTSETVDATLGVRDEEMLVFDIYPNPSNQFVTIQLPVGLSSSSVEIYDYSGRNIKSAKINRLDNKLDLSDVSQGLYFIMLNSDGKSGVQTLIRN